LEGGLPDGQKEGVSVNETSENRKKCQAEVGGDAIHTQDPLREKASVTADAEASMQMHAKTMMDRTDDRVDAQ
jgi:hypothetical protein